jgi:hypothetical protein
MKLVVNMSMEAEDIGGDTADAEHLVSNCDLCIILIWGWKFNTSD